MNARPDPVVELGIMGMPIILDLRDELEPHAIESMWNALRRADALFSTYKDDSEISRLNRGELALEDAEPDVREVLARCDELRVITDGYFDAGRVLESGIDPSGLVKGWAVDRAGEVLDAAGARNYSLNAGGDIRVRGAPLPEPHWRIGIPMMPSSTMGSGLAFTHLQPVHGPRCVDARPDP